MLKFFKIILDVVPYWNKIILGQSTDGSKTWNHGLTYLYIPGIKRGKVSVRNVRSSVTLGVANSVANDVTMRIAGLWRYDDWWHVGPTGWQRSSNSSFWRRQQTEDDSQYRWVRMTERKQRANLKSNLMSQIPQLQACGIICVIVCLAISVEHHLVTDGRTDGHTVTQ